MTVQDILSMDAETFNKLGVLDMRKVVGRLVSAGNKRLRSFEKAGVNSPAVRQVSKSGGAFSTKGKDLNALRAEYTRARNFLQAKTGTRKGWEKTKKDTVKALREQGVDISAEEFEDLWQAYEDLKEMSPEVANRGLKYSALKEIADMLGDDAPSAEEIAATLHERIDEIYEQGIDSDVDGVSGFFEI